MFLSFFLDKGLLLEGGLLTAGHSFLQAEVYRIIL
jgi:hypothetical protein